MSRPTPYSGSHVVFGQDHGLVTVVLADGREVEIAPTAGDLSIGEMSEGGRAAIPVRNRGQAPIAMLRGASQEVSIQMTAIHAGPLTDTSQTTLTDVLLRQGSAAGAATRDPGGEVYTVDIRYVGSHQGQRVEIRAYNVRASIAYAESESGNTLTITGTAYGYTSGGVEQPPVVYS